MIKKRRDIWDTMKRCNCSSRKREERKWTEAIFEEIVVKNFSNFGRTTLQNLGLWAPVELMQRKPSFRHIPAISGYWRQRNLKSIQRCWKAEDFEKAKPTTDFWRETIRVTRQLSNFPKVMKENNLVNLEFFTQQNIL